MSCFWEFFSFFLQFINLLIQLYIIRFSAYREIFVAYVRFIFEIYATLKKYKTISFISIFLLFHL